MMKNSKSCLENINYVSQSLVQNQPRVRERERDRTLRKFVLETLAGAAPIPFEIETVICQKNDRLARPQENFR
jgi:hypothetical protein